MSIKLMKQRWLVEGVDDKKDSTEIVSTFQEIMYFVTTDFQEFCQ